MYHSRNPRASPLWRCAQRHGKELREAGRFQRAVEERTLEHFIACGDPHHGFARIYCDACGHDYLLAFSCKTRYFCPSCHQKHVLLYGDLVNFNPHLHVLAADGAFLADGRFAALPPVPGTLLAEGFRRITR